MSKNYEKFIFHTGIFSLAKNVFKNMANFVAFRWNLLYFLVSLLMGKQKKTNDKSLLFSPWRTYPLMTYPVPGHFAPCQTAKNSWLVLFSSPKFYGKLCVMVTFPSHLNYVKRIDLKSWICVDLFSLVFHSWTRKTPQKDFYTSV